MYHKRIIVDFDDTLAFHHNRDFDAAVPNLPLIKKLNSLYDQGWQIDIFTARGSISCTSREAARAKYEPGMRAWLNKYGVKFHALSFDKPLAAYYIDDKGIMPEDFLNVDIRQLEGGLSGTDLYTDGKVVHKQDPAAHSTRAWFETASESGIKTPLIHRVVGQTITMDYIDHDEAFFANNFYVALGMIQTQLHNMAKIKPANNLKFESYIKRIQEHAEKSEKEALKAAAHALCNYDLVPSFAHGDFGIKNMLFKNNDVYLIDPICDVFGCTELDAAKFCASLIINKYPQRHVSRSIDFMSVMNDIDKNLLLILIRAEIARVYKYHPDKQFILNCINYVH